MKTCLALLSMIIIVFIAANQMWTQTEQSEVENHDSETNQSTSDPVPTNESDASAHQNEDAASVEQVTSMNSEELDAYLDHHTFYAIRTTEEFVHIITTSEKMIFVDFYGTYCPPCMRVLPIIEKVAEEFPDIHFLKMDVTINSRFISNTFTIYTIPAFLVTYQNFMVGSSFLGVKSFDTYVGIIENKMQIVNENPHLFEGNAYDNSNSIRPTGL